MYWLWESNTDLFVQFVMMMMMMMLVTATSGEVAR